MCCGARAWRRVVLVAGFLLTGGAAQAQDQPKQQPQDQPKYEVTGFRDARFGMTEADVRAAVKKSLAVQDADIKTGANPTEGTALLIVRVDSLDPGPGPATITYIFGNKSKKLIQVNVVWGEDAVIQTMPMRSSERARGSSVISRASADAKTRRGWGFPSARTPSFSSPARMRKRARCGSSSMASSIR